MPLVCVLALVVAVPFVSPGRLRVLFVITITGSVGIVALGRFQSGAGIEGAAPEWVKDTLLLFFVPLNVGLVAFAGWHNHIVLTRRADELRRSRARVVQATDRARRNLERDLHDGAQQLLVGATVQLRAAHRLVTTDPRRAATVIDSTTIALHGAIEDLRNLAHGVYPAVLTDHGLVEALSAAARSCSSLVSVAAVQVGRYQPDVEAGVYFCCLEAIQNALKHGGEYVAVQLGLDGRQGLTFTVSDNGPGFAYYAASGYGLTNMQDRIGALGGTLTIDSQPPHGTSITGHIDTNRQPTLPGTLLVSVV
jgi:signal transduction histidine kinase